MTDLAHLTGDEAMQATMFKQRVASLADTSREEDLADEALLAVFNLRDRLVVIGRNTEACRVDQIMEMLEAIARDLIQ